MPLKELVGPPLDAPGKVTALRAAAAIMARTLAKHVAPSAARDAAMAHLSEALGVAEKAVAAQDTRPPCR